MSQPAIRINSLTIGYENKKEFSKIAHQITASIYAGELTCLIGPNGVGKSTLLRTISKLQPMHGGIVELLGENINEIRKEKLATLLSVVLTERPSVYTISVKEMVAMGRSPYTNYWGSLSKEDDKIVVEVIEMVGVQSLTHRIFATLSDGEKQKVMIAKALAQQTPIILLDEPTSFLDYPSKIELMQLLQHLAQQMQKTILFSTHDLDLALQVCDKMAIMSPTEIVVGTPEDLSLSGQLNRFLKIKGVVFDSESGLFKVQHNYHWAIRIEGEDAPYFMLHKALLRKGILSNNEIQSEAYISVAQNSFTLYLPSEETFTATTIEQLLSYSDLMKCVIPLSE